MLPNECFLCLRGILASALNNMFSMLSEEIATTACPLRGLFVTKVALRRQKGNAQTTGISSYTIYSGSQMIVIHDVVQ
jgi:hypothetical protein